jgi:hypothetical protein
LGYVNSVHSAISSTFFYKCDNSITLGNAVFEYWIDDHFEARQQQTFANMGGITLNLNLSGLNEEGLHRLNYRIGNQGGGFGSISMDVSKEYSASAKISKRIGTPKWANWFGVDWSITINAGVFMESKFPLLESNYDFSTKEMRPIVKYEDINKSAYYLPQSTFEYEVNALPKKKMQAR